MNGHPEPLPQSTTYQGQLDYTVALKAAGLGIWELDPATNVVNWDDRCRELYGLIHDNRLPYEQAIRYIHPDDMTRIDEAVKWATNPKSSGRYDATYRTIGADDGQLRWVKFWGQCYFTESGGIARFTGASSTSTANCCCRSRSKTCWVTS